MAFIQKTTVPVSFQGGLASKTDALQVQAPALLGLKNAKFDKVGSLNKRPGYDILSTATLSGGSLTSAVALASYNGELNLFDNASAYTYIEATGTWANRGPAISLINSNQQIIRKSSAQQLNPDCATLGGLQVFVWEDTRGTCRYSVLDAATGAYAVADKAVTGSLSCPKVLAFGGVFFILFASNNNLSYVTINPANPGVVTPVVNLVSDATPGFMYDATVSNNRLYVVYFAAAQLNLFYILSPISGVLGFVDVGSGSTGTSCCVVGDSSNHVWVGFASGLPAVSVACYNGVPSTPTVILAPTLVAAVSCPTLTGIESINAGSLQLVYEVTGAIPSQQITKSVIVQTSGAITTVGTLRSVGLASKPFRYLSNIYVNLAYQSTLQSTYFTALLSGAPFTIVGKVAPQVGGGLRTNGLVAEANQATPGVVLWANLTKGQFISEDNTSFSLLGVSASTSDFTATNKFSSTTFSNNLLVVGGILQSYDGVSVAEQNFHVFPEDITLVANGSGGALSAGQYQYQVIYSWQDRFGQIQFSSPSPAFTITTVVNDSVTLTLPTLRLTAKTGVEIKVYRTQVNSTVFQEVTSELAPLISTGHAPTINSIVTDTVAFLDVTADVEIAANQTIYTTGGVLPNSAPPSCSLIGLYGDRVLLGGLEDANTLWFSKNQSNRSDYNTIPAEFSADLTISVSAVGGPITALGLMDSNLIIFKRDAIFVMTGDGPNDAGGGTNYGDPQLITSSVGCVNPASVVVTTAGIMFQTPDKGIWLLDRGLDAPQYIGSGVDEYARNNVVSSATLDPNSNSVIFTTYNGPALVYDYLISQWGTWTNHQAVGAVAFGGVFTFCKSNGQVYQQNPAIFYDGILQSVQVPYSLEVTTPWMSYSNVLGYQSIFRVFILGQYRGAHTLNVSVGYDFNPSFTATVAIPASTLPPGVVWGSDPVWGSSTPWGGVWSPYVFQVNMPVQKCSAFRLKIGDSQLVNANVEGYTLSSLLLELGQLPNGVRIPAGRKFAAQ